MQVRLHRNSDRQACVGFLSLVVAGESRWLILSYIINYIWFSLRYLGASSWMTLKVISRIYTISNWEPVKISLKLE